MRCDLQLRELKRPIAEFKTTLLDSTPAVTIQLPQVIGVRFEQTARLRGSESMVFAAQQADGIHLLTIVSATPEARPQSK